MLARSLVSCRSFMPFHFKSCRAFKIHELFNSTFGRTLEHVIDKLLKTFARFVFGFRFAGVFRQYWLRLFDEKKRFVDTCRTRVVDATLLTDVADATSFKFSVTIGINQFNFSLKATEKQFRRKTFHQTQLDVAEAKVQSSLANLHTWEVLRKR